MSKSFRLQELVKVVTNLSQIKQDAVDVGGFRHVVIQVRVPVKDTAAGALLYIQESNVLEDEAFTDIPNVTVDLFASSNKVIRLTDTARFLRWRVGGLTTSVQFMADGLART